MRVVIFATHPRRDARVARGAAATLFVSFVVLLVKGTELLALLRNCGCEGGVGIRKAFQGGDDLGEAFVDCHERAGVDAHGVGEVIHITSHRIGFFLVTQRGRRGEGIKSNGGFLLLRLRSGKSSERLASFVAEAVRTNASRVGIAEGGFPRTLCTLALWEPSVCVCVTCLPGRRTYRWNRSVSR